MIGSIHDDEPNRYKTASDSGKAELGTKLTVAKPTRRHRLGAPVIPAQAGIQWRASAFNVCKKYPYIAILMK